MKVCSVSYLNSIPFVYGLENSPLNIELSTAIPSLCAKKLIEGSVDLALVPVAIIPELTYSKIISPFCISATGVVETVCLFSQCPINEIDTILLDYHSRTSNQLIQLLSKKYWNISPKFIQPDTEFVHQIKDHTAGLIIGDRAYQYRSDFPYTYDLSQEWQKYTGLPFVFACWVANSPIDMYFEQQFTEALQFGISNLNQAIKEKEHQFITSIDKRRYLTEVIDYHFDREKKQSLDLFLKKIQKA